MNLWHFFILIPAEAECSKAKKATCLNEQCAKVNGTEICQCPTGYELHSNGTSCIGTKSFEMKAYVFFGDLVRCQYILQQDTLFDLATYLKHNRYNFLKHECIYRNKW